MALINRSAPGKSPGNRGTELGVLNDIYRKLIEITSNSTSNSGNATLAEQQSQTALLTSLVGSLLYDRDIEFLLVRDTGNSNLVVRQLVSYDENTGGFTTSYETIDGNQYTPQGTMEYLDSSASLGQIILKLQELIDEDDFSIIESLGYDSGALSPITIGSPAVGNSFPFAGPVPDFTIITPNKSFSYLEYNRDHQVKVSITGGFPITGIVNLYFEYSSITPNAGVAGARFYLDNPTSSLTIDTIIIPSFTNPGNESQIVKLTFDNTTTNYTSLNLRIHTNSNANYPANYSLEALGAGINNYTVKDLITRVDTYRDSALVNTVYKDSSNQIYNLRGTYIRDSSISIESKIQELINETDYEILHTYGQDIDPIIELIYDPVLNSTNSADLKVKVNNDGKDFVFNYNTAGTNSINISFGNDFSIINQIDINFDLNIIDRNGFIGGFNPTIELIEIGSNIILDTVTPTFNEGFKGNNIQLSYNNTLTRYNEIGIRIVMDFKTSLWEIKNLSLKNIHHDIIKKVEKYEDNNLVSTTYFDLNNDSYTIKGYFRPFVNYKKENDEYRRSKFSKYVADNVNIATIQTLSTSQEVMLYNNSNAIVYVLLSEDVTVSNNDFSVKILPNDMFIWTKPPNTVDITIIWDSTFTGVLTGTLNVTEQNK